MHYAQLTDRGLIEISGEEAGVFLQGLVSNDVSVVKKGEAVYAALLTPQGKFLHDFFLLPWKESILIDCAKSSLPDLLPRLNMYKLRSKVAIKAMPEDRGVTAVWGGKDSGFRVQDSGFRIFPDPRLPPLGHRLIGETAAVESWCAEKKITRGNAEDYKKMRLELGVPDGARDMLRDKSLLLEFGFEDLHGVDFKKGCYVGQEVTARSKYRGQVRRFIYQVRADGALPPPGTAVTLNGVPVGELRSIQGNIGLALLKVAEVEKSQTGKINFQAGDKAFKAILPSWAAHPPKALIAPE